MARRRGANTQGRFIHDCPLLQTYNFLGPASECKGNLGILNNLGGWEPRCVNFPWGVHWKRLIHVEINNILKYLMKS